MIGPSGVVSGGGGADTAEALAFISRATTAFPAMSGTDQTTFKTFINGLVNTASTSSGTGRNALFDRFDMLNIFAGPDATLALLSLINSTYAASPTSPAPTFTAYRGFNGNGTTSNLGSNFNAATATTPNYKQDFAHLSCWNLTSAVETIPLIDTASAKLYPEFSGGDFYFRVNETTSGSVAIVGSVGHLLGNRSAASGAGCEQGYKNGTLLGTNSTASVALVNFNTFPLNQNSTRQNAMFSCGDSLSATDVSNFYTLLHTCLNTLNPTAFP